MAFDLCGFVRRVRVKKKPDNEELVGPCRARDVYFVVDAIQGLGALTLDVSETPIESSRAAGRNGCSRRGARVLRMCAEPCWSP